MLTSALAALAPGAPVAYFGEGGVARAVAGDDAVGGAQGHVVRHSPLLGALML